jgi:ABC-2 type transport system ATP-binding protein
VRAAIAPETGSRRGGRVWQAGRVPAAVEIEALTRVFPPAGRNADPRTALDHIDLTIDEGEVHGLLGPNGAGKTTLCKILSTVLLPTSGRARVAGHDVVTDTARVRPLIGIVFGGERGLYTRLTARQNLRYWAALYRVPNGLAKPRVESLLQRVGLADRADHRVETFSRGMKQRLHLARGLIGDPRVLFLDEPTTGMDPVAAHEFRALVAQQRAEGRTILVTTHDMAEAEAVCDRVTLIDGGKLLRTESPRTIGGWISAHERVDARHVPTPVREQVAEIGGVSRIEDLDADTIRVHTNADGAASEVLKTLVASGITGISTGRPSLEEVYLHVIGSRGLSI